MNQHEREGVHGDGPFTDLARAKISRRSFLEGAALTGVVVGASSLLARSPAAAAAQASRVPVAQLSGIEQQRAAVTGSVVPLSKVRASQPNQFEPDVWVNRPFGLSDVSIDSGVYKRGQDQGLALARAYSVDRILAVFRRNAGLDTKGATPPGGWEEYGPAPDTQKWGAAEYVRGQNKAGAGGLLRGHYAGHFLSMISMAYASTGEAALKSRVDELVVGLKECRDALAAQTYQGKPRYSHPGFLSAYGEWQFSALEEYAPYGEIWAPYYTLHKILDGLNNAYLLTGSQDSLELAEGIGRWVYSRLSKCTSDQLTKMWSIYIGGEYGGMNDSLVDLYSASKATDRHVFLKAARLFDLPTLIDACAQGRDTLNGKHANQHIPQFVGYAKLYAVTGEERYLKAVKGFFDMIVPGRMYAHGGTGEGELWGPADTVAGDIGSRNAESCAAYNMVKVAWQLFHITGEQRYSDYCERTVLNHLLGGHRDKNSTTSPENLYMFPVHAGAQKEYGDGNIGTCCGGTGMESPMRYQETAYAHSADNTTLFVNFLMPSTLTWQEKGLVLRVSSEYPLDGKATLEVVSAPSTSLEIAIRVPEWVTGEASAAVSGAKVTSSGGAYIRIKRTWAAGDKIALSVPMRVWVDPTVDRPELQALRYGPVVYAAVGKTTKFPQISLSAMYDLSGGLNHAATWNGTSLILAGREFDPLYAGHDIYYSTYFERVEKSIAFGGQDSGVLNMQGANGSAFLDELWTAAPFASRADFLERVRDLSKQYQDSGAMTSKDRQKVLLAASRARMEK